MHRTTHPLPRMGNSREAPRPSGSTLTADRENGLQGALRYCEWWRPASLSQAM